MDAKEFRDYAVKHKGISGNTFDDFKKYSINSMAGAGIYSSVTPAVIEERQMQIQAIDVFSRLMMDRLIWLGMPIYDEVANIIQAQLLLSLHHRNPQFAFENDSSFGGPNGLHLIGGVTLGENIGNHVVALIGLLGSRIHFNRLHLGLY